MLSFFSTWQEMKAKNVDFKKVTQIVREQIHEALWNERLESLDKFRRNLAKNDFKKIWEKRARLVRYVDHCVNYLFYSVCGCNSILEKTWRRSTILK